MSGVDGDILPRTKKARHLSASLANMLTVKRVCGEIAEWPEINNPTEIRRKEPLKKVKEHSNSKLWCQHLLESTQLSHICWEGRIHALYRCCKLHADRRCRNEEVGVSLLDKLCQKSA